MDEQARRADEQTAETAMLRAELQKRVERDMTDVLSQSKSSVAERDLIAEREDMMQHAAQLQEQLDVARADAQRHAQQAAVELATLQHTLRSAQAAEQAARASLADITLQHQLLVEQQRAREEQQA